MKCTERGLSPLFFAHKEGLLGSSQPWGPSIKVDRQYYATAILWQRMATHGNAWQRMVHDLIRNSIGSLFYMPNDLTSPAGKKPSSRFG
jgi:hypothetical protein